MGLVTPSPMMYALMGFVAFSFVALGFVIGYFVGRGSKNKN
ncbi:MAG TPA: hypothetical protein VL651_16060 [Bacteroidia bacterium]|jgi:hypothetical protein|nr:hypothetical protein [Bacteroidia bacterium]